MIVAHIRRLGGDDEYFGPFPDKDAAEKWIRASYVYTKWEVATPIDLQIKEPYE